MGRPMATPVGLSVQDNRSSAMVNVLAIPRVSVPSNSTLFVEWMARPMATPVGLSVKDNKSSAMVNAHVLPSQPASVPLSTTLFVEWMARPIATPVRLVVLMYQLHILECVYNNDILVFFGFLV